MGYGKVVREEPRVPSREVRHAMPHVYAGYKRLYASALAAGALNVRINELIALAIAVSKQSDGCISAHAHAAVLHGATPGRGGRGDWRHVPDERQPGHCVRRARRSPRSRCSTPSTPPSRTGSSRPPADVYPPGGYIGRSTDVRTRTGIFG